MQTIKLLSLLIISTIISLHLQSCSSSSSPENVKTEATNTTEQTGSPEVRSTSSTEPTTVNSKEEPASSEEASTNPVMEKIAENKTEKNSSSSENVESEKETKSSVESDIQFIRDKFGVITNATNYIVDSTTVECLQGMTVIERRSTNDGELRYLLENSCSDHGCVTTHHYFWDKELIFIFRENYYYAGNSDYKQEHRTYFKNNKMFRCLEKDVSTTKGFEALKKKLKNTSNTTVECTPNKRTSNLQQLIDLDLKKAKAFFCE